MTTTPTEGIKTVLHPVSDLEKAEALYTCSARHPSTTRRTTSATTWPASTSGSCPAAGPST
jgi:hypothetical protein